MEATATVTSTELESQFEAAVVVTEISTAEVVAKEDSSGAEVIAQDCSGEMKVSTDNGSTNDVFFTIEDCIQIEMKSSTGDGAEVVHLTIEEDLKDPSSGNGASVISSTIKYCMEELKDCTGNGTRVLTEVKATEVLLVDDSTGNGAGVVTEVKATEVSSTIEDCIEDLNDPSGNGVSVFSSKIKDCMEELKDITGNAAEVKATEVSSKSEDCMEESKDSAGNGAGVFAEVKTIEVFSTIEEDLKDSTGNGAGVFKATGDCKDSDARNGAETLKAIDIHSTMVASNDDGINLVVELSIEKSDEIASWGDVPDENVEDPPVVAAGTPRFVKRPRPPPENVDVDDIVQTMRNILMDLRNAEDARLKPEDEEKVRSVLVHHPEADEKMGSGIDHIKIKRHSAFKESRCFWVVRTDGSEIDFSYHKCLKQKVAKEHPDFVDRYDAIYRAPKRARQA